MDRRARRTIERTREHVIARRNRVGLDLLVADASERPGLIQIYESCDEGVAHLTSLLTDEGDTLTITDATLV